MKSISVRKRVWLLVAIASLVLATLGMAGVFVFALKLRYVLLGISVFLVGHGLYGAPFYLVAFDNFRATEKILSAMESGADTLSEISEKTRLKPDFIKKLLQKAKKRGFISEISLNEAPTEVK